MTGYFVGRSARRLRWWSTHALLLCFVVRSLVPYGYMPEFGASVADGLQVVICTGSETKTIVLEATSKPNGELPSKHNGEHCAFAALAALHLPDEPPGITANPIDQQVVRSVRSATFAPPLRRTVYALGARAPPHST